MTMSMTTMILYAYIVAKNRKMIAKNRQKKRRHATAVREWNITRFPTGDGFVAVA